ncbi:MAG: Bax inhibitor-1/YccA family protein [Coxiellaceae bacterium]|nr:Bax inhibitor-1/YccA family protein [Coxiellaceae bacterium]
MDQKQSSVIQRRSESVLTTNSVIRNTYLLLSLTLVFSAFTAWFSMSSNAQPGVGFILIGYFGLMFAVNALRKSAWGILAIFAFTGFLGYTLGPILNSYIHNFSNGSEIIMTALGGTGVIFFALSGYALVTRKDFSYMGGFLFVAFTVAFIGGLASMFFQLPLLNLLVSGAFVLLSSAYILFTTSRMINGGERNYIMATMALYVALFNIFISLLNILGFMGGKR